MASLIQRKWHSEINLGGIFLNIKISKKEVCHCVPSLRQLLYVHNTQIYNKHTNVILSSLFLQTREWRLNWVSLSNYFKVKNQAGAQVQMAFFLSHLEGSSHKRRERKENGKEQALLLKKKPSVHTVRLSTYACLWDAERPRNFDIDIVRNIGFKNIIPRWWFQDGPNRNSSSL